MLRNTVKHPAVSWKTAKRSVRNPTVYANDNACTDGSLVSLSTRRLESSLIRLDTELLHVNAVTSPVSYQNTLL